MIHQHHRLHDILHQLFHERHYHLRNPNKPLIAGSLRASPVERYCQKQLSFDIRLPLDEEEKRTSDAIQTPVNQPGNQPSMIISPIRSSTPEQIIKSPSVIPKSAEAPQSSFEFSIIPIECRYHFKRLRQRCTFETIKTHHEFLINKHKTLENEREQQLQSSFPEQLRRIVVKFVESSIEKTLDNKKKSDQNRLDNLLLDQMREKATIEIKRIATTSEQQCIQDMHTKFTRTLDLKLQLDKLEKRFVENMPPPSLNVIDRLELHAKGLKSENNQLKTLKEQWKNTLRRTKLELTTLMRQAKVAEIEEAKREYEELAKKLPKHLQENYDILCHVAQTRHEQFAKKKLNFLAKRACAMSEN